MGVAVHRDVLMGWCFRKTNPLTRGPIVKLVFHVSKGKRENKIKIIHFEVKTPWKYNFKNAYTVWCRKPNIRGNDRQSVLNCKKLGQRNISTFFEQWRTRGEGHVPLAPL